MKSTFKSENASFYDLNYISLVELLYEEVDEEEDEKSMEEDKSFEITPEAYEKILIDIFSKIRSYAKQKELSPIEIFKGDVALVEEETTKKRYHIIELKDFIERLDTVVEINLKELEIYCLYTKLKFDEVENELEAISYDKLKMDLEQFDCLNQNSAKFSKKLRLLSMSKDVKSSIKAGTSIGDNLKQVKNDNIDYDEYKGVESTSSINNDFISLKQLISNLKSYLFSSNISINELFNDEHIKTINNDNLVKKVIPYSSFYETLYDKNIVKKKLSIDEFAEFIIVTDKSEDIVIDYKMFLDYINRELREKEVKPQYRPQSGKYISNKYEKADKAEATVNEIKENDKNENIDENENDENEGQFDIID